MRRKIEITHTTFVGTAVFGSLFIVIALSLFVLWTSRQTVVATDQAVSAVSSFYLEAIADRRSREITNLIDDNFVQMGEALEFIKDERIESQDDLRETIGRLESLLSLNRFALVDADDTVYARYTTYSGGSRYAFLSQDPMDSRVISTVSEYGSSRQLCLAIPTPGLTVMGKPFKACFLQLDIKDIVDLLAFNDKGRTYFALYSRSGENLSGTDLGPCLSSRSFFDATRHVLPEAVWKENYNNFANGLEGSITFESDGAEETLCYAPIEGTDWEMAVLIRGSVIEDQIRDISEKNLLHSRILVVFTLASVVLLAVVLLLQARVLAQKKLEEEKKASEAFQLMARTDSLTGVGNKHAYTESEEAVNERIRSGKLREVDIVVGDVNGLKYVNDTQGHAAGDKLITDASSMLGEYFAQGTVFRIGGDEFVVLVEGEGVEALDEVASEFNRKVEANIGDDDVVVSIGYAVLEPKDGELRDVFERADRMMYARKTELKSRGAHTRE